jgi:hypothetical protein
MVVGTIFFKGECIVRNVHDIVACHLKARVSESRRVSIATQWLADTFPHQPTDEVHRYTAAW